LPLTLEQRYQFKSIKIQNIDLGLEVWHSINFQNTATIAQLSLMLFKKLSIPGLLIL